MGRSRTLAAVTALGLCILATGASAVSRHGGAGSDRLVGTRAADTLRGRAGDDKLLGGRGKDLLIGGGGDDRLIGGGGRDGFNMRAGVQLKAPGDDRIEARDGVADEINCGDGDDVAIVDEVESGVYDCETVKEPAA